MFARKRRVIGRAILAMTDPVTPHFQTGWRAFKSSPRIFLISMLILFASWVALELAVVALHRLGFVVWLVLHLAFFVVFSGLMVGLHSIAMQTVDGQTTNLRDLTALLGRGPIFFLASCIYCAAVAGGLVFLVVPGIYVAVRYALFGYVLAERSTSALGALRDAAALSDGHWWTVCAVLIKVLLLNLVGAALLGLGLLITFPISVLATSSLYRSLQRPAL